MQKAREHQKQHHQRAQWEHEPRHIAPVLTHINRPGKGHYLDGLGFLRHSSGQQGTFDGRLPPKLQEIEKPIAHLGEVLPNLLGGIIVRKESVEIEKLVERAQTIVGQNRNASQKATIYHACAQLWAKMPKPL